MSALLFLLSVAAIFALVLAIEARGAAATLPRRPVGLIAWLTGGNWPAKLGGGLLVVGVGALLRFALINLDFAPSVKLASGVAAAGLLALGATLTRLGSGRRAVSLALGGAAFGVAYLTAYSAFALVHYLDGTNGVALLALTAVGAGVYAITRGALSLALLAMLGAFLAPAFAINDPGPAIVFGYLAGASTLTLVMVAARGWRPLIHLSFLFTLGGGAFFAWTGKYYGPAHAAVMLPALLGLTGLHALMPILERRDSKSVWIERLDLIYLLALPVVAGLSAVAIAPSRPVLSNEFAALAAIWFALAAYLGLTRRDGAVVHAVIGIVLAGATVAARFSDLPWELLALAFTVLALWLAARRSASTVLTSTLAGLVPIAGIFHVLSSLATPPASTAFLNALFLERIIGAGLLIFAGYLCRTIRHSLDTLLLSVGIGWGVIALGIELVRWDLVSLALVVHAAFLLAAAFLAFVRIEGRSVPDAIVGVTLGVLFSASWAAVSAPVEMSWGALALAPLVLVWLSVRRAGAEPATRVGRMLAAVTAPIVAGLWAMHTGKLAGIDAPQFPFCAAVVAALGVAILGDIAHRRCADWRATAVHMCAFAFAVPLAIATTAAIGRSPWAVALELLCLAGLALLVLRERDVAPLPRWVAPACALGAGLVVQTSLLRAFGPPGDLDLRELAHMRYTALTSFVWAMLGAIMTVWGRRRLSRPLWMGGAVLMVAAAAKVALLDFGSLGQLANILAVIGAGVVFLLVGWLAPMPPAAPESLEEPAGEPPPSPLRAAAAAARAPSATRPEPRVFPVAASRVADTPRSVPPPEAAAAPLAGSVPAPESAGTPEPSTNEYFARNAGHAARAPRSDTARDPGSQTAWTVVILAVLVLPMTQCGRASHRFIRDHLTAPPLPVDASQPTVPPPAPAVALTQNVAPASGLAQDVNLGTAAAGQAPPASDCARWAAGLPADYRVYASGGYQAPIPNRKLSGFAARMSTFNVTADASDRNVVLLLGAYRSSVWSIHFGPASRIVGVWISGYEPQFVTGLPADVAVLRTSAADRGACPWFAVASEGAPNAASAATLVLNRSIDATFPATDGLIELSPGPAAAALAAPGSAALDPVREAVPVGHASIATLIDAGLLRPATIHDLVTWKNSPAIAELTHIRVQGHSEVLTGTYVVGGAIEVPLPTGSRDLVTLVVPPGVPRPHGNPGQFRIIELGR